MVPSWQWDMEYAGHLFSKVIPKPYALPIYVKVITFCFAQIHTVAVVEAPLYIQRLLPYYISLNLSTKPLFNKH